MADLMVYKMFATATASTDAAATLDIVFDGVIEGLVLDTVMQNADALNDAVGAELSFASVSGFVTNDTRASIIGSRIAQGFLTSGGGPTGKVTNVAFGPDGIPVSAGERMYLHLLLVGAGTLIASVWLYVRTSGGARADRRRT